MSSLIQEQSKTESTPRKFKKIIHLLYVPTIFCNLGCEYCYLGKLTDQRLSSKEEQKAIDTLRFALDKFVASDILPFNVSLHGGEVTTLTPGTLEQLYSLIRSHYLTYFDQLTANGFNKINPHIKTNLFNFDKLWDLMTENNVSISASIDLPLSLHEKYRTTKNGKSTLKKTLDNLALLGKYPHNKKISAVLYEEHFDQVDELIADIWRIHKETGFDMNRFNFMFGFNSSQNDDKFGESSSLDTTPLSDQKQVAFYQKMKAAFMGTELEYGLRKNWFDEFSPSYCTSAFNCGERFFLLQSDGNIFSCVRGQGVEPLHYGNIFENTPEDILKAGIQKVASIHREQKFHPDCQSCEYLHVCNTGCPFVKNEMQSGKSYTCALQKEIYKDNPNSYPPAVNKEQQILLSEDYKFKMHPHMVTENDRKKKINYVVPNELSDVRNNLKTIIDEDDQLRELYSDQAIHLEFNQDLYPLESQLLKVQRSFFHFDGEDELKLHISKNFFEANSKELIRNTLHLQLLRDTKVVYGDEKRTKQEHIVTHQVFHNLLSESSHMGTDFFEFDLSNFLKFSQHYFMEDVLNNLFVTTGMLREYHYTKQKQNAFYHIQAINLPFQNIEFYWDK